jgi:hypothetical protein
VKKHGLSMKFMIHMCSVHQPLTPPAFRGTNDSSCRIHYILEAHSRTPLSDSLILARDSSVGIATGYGLDNRMIEVQFPAGAGNFSLRRSAELRAG